MLLNTSELGRWPWKSRRVRCECTIISLRYDAKCLQSNNCYIRSFIERAPDIYFYSTLVVHLLELLWSIASAAVGSAMINECPAERMIPISLIGETAGR